MKEATGELNVTVIALIIVGMLSALFFTVIFPNIRNNFKSNTKCDKAICNCNKDASGNCTNVKDGKITCKYYDKSGAHDIVCAWKG